jgi:hypothetical protein
MATSNYQERELTIDGARIRYCKGGDGPPLVALHSVEGHLGWLPLYDELTRDFTVYAPIIRALPDPTDQHGSRVSLIFHVSICGSYKSWELPR